MEVYMNFSQDVMLVLLLGLLANQNDTNLATNSNILLLLLLALAGINNNDNNNWSCANTCPGNTRFF